MRPVRPGSGNALYRALPAQARDHWQRRDRPTRVGLFPAQLAEQGFNLGYSGKWHAGLVRTANDMGFVGFGPQGYGSVEGAEHDAWLARKGLNKPPAVIEFYAEGVPKRAFGDSSGYLDGPTEATPTAFVADTAIDLLDAFAQANGNEASYNSEMGLILGLGPVGGHARMEMVGNTANTNGAPCNGSGMSMGEDADGLGVAPRPVCP